MSFWQKENFPYIKVIELSDDGLLVIANVLTREDIIEWLTWNDPNGIYNDEQSMKEFGKIMNRAEGLEIFLRQAEENRV